MVPFKAFLIYTDIYCPNNFCFIYNYRKKITIFLLINSSTFSPASRHWASDVAVAPISQSTKFFKKTFSFLPSFRFLSLYPTWVYLRLRGQYQFQKIYRLGKWDIRSVTPAMLSILLLYERSQRWRLEGPPTSGGQQHDDPDLATRGSSERKLDTGSDVFTRRS